MFMPQNFLDLHIVGFCQLDCKHCYLNKGNRVMPLDMLRTICEDFLSTNFPLPRSELILSGGEPLLHPKFVETIARRLALLAIPHFKRDAYGSEEINVNNKGNVVTY